MCVTKPDPMSVDYRALIGYLTEVIDACTLRAANFQNTRDQSEADEVDRMDTAIRTMENAVRLILDELEERRWNGHGDAENLPSTPNLDWLSEVFPNTRAGRALRSRFFEVCSEDARAAAKARQ